MNASTGKFWLLMGGALAVLAAAVAISPMVGSHPLSWSAAFDSSIPGNRNVDRLILFELRLPRMVLGVVVGATLAAAGSVFQCLLRNDLATPYTLGVSGGASFFALLALHLSALPMLAAVPAWMAMPLAAFVGAGLAVTLILGFARRVGSPDRVETLVLAGVTLNLIFAAGILIVQFRANPYEAYGMLRWMMGGLDITQARVPYILLVPLAGMLIVLMSRSAALNVMSFGDSTAAHLGFDAHRVRMVALGVSALMTSLVVAWAGPIGFVGLIVPNALRRIAGPDQRRLIPLSAVTGAAFLVACDTLARLIGGRAELPVGIVTSCIGGPFFLWLLFRKSNR